TRAQTRKDDRRRGHALATPDIVLSETRRCAGAGNGAPSWSQIILRGRHRGYSVTNEHGSPVRSRPRLLLLLRAETAAKGFACASSRRGGGCPGRRGRSRA